MASRSIAIIAAATLTALGAGGYWWYSVNAAQAQGSLAQAPLNVQTAVAPALMIATDDSGSMMFQNQFPGADGKACWSNDATGQPWSFFHTTGANAGQLRAVRRGSNGICDYAYSYGNSRRLNDWNPFNLPSIPDLQGNQVDSWVGIPPVDNYGFARSHEFNPAYFNPGTTYLPWLTDTATPYAAATATAARVDPRPLGTSFGSVNLTVTHTESRQANGNGQLSDKFRAFNQMVLPSGTQYQLVRNENCGGLTGGGVWRTLSSNHTMTASCNVYIAHYLPTFFLAESTPVPAGYESVSRTLVNNACGAGCNMYKYTIAASDTAAMQNFANWFQYYGNRHKALVAGLTHSLNTVTNMRIGYFRISQHGSFDVPNVTSALNPSSHERVTMRDISIQAQKTALFDAVLANPSWGSTFNRQAVFAAGAQFRRTDPLNSTSNGAPIQLACQRNAVLLFTDGYSNNNGPTVGNVDSGMGAPFSDTHEDTLADIASRYYLDSADGGLAPLRSDAGFPAGQVPVSSACPASGPSTDPKLNCQRNLHVNFYGITLNGRGDLFDPDVDRDPYTEAAVYNNWPARQNDNRSTIDDIWHAAVNTRGELVNARTPSDITEAMRRILRAIASDDAPSGTLAISGSRISERSISVAPGYGIDNEGTDWYGTLSGSKTSLDLATGVITETNIWHAHNVLASMSASTRASHTWFGRASGTAKLEDSNITSFNSFCNNPLPGMTRCTGAEIAGLGISIGQAINYLLGDTSLEVRNGGPLRDRTTVLGDIVNSSPVVSAPTDDYGYRRLGTIGAVNYGATYDTYMADKLLRPAMVYVGANDGMLHGFHGGINHLGVVDTTNAGRQKFAYIPRAVLGHTGNLLFAYDAFSVGQKFDHRYFVDGHVAVGDAYFGGGWKTSLVAAAGAGGRSVFAFDVSNPDSFTSSSNRLWEIDDQNTNADVRDNIGHVLGKPVIAPFRNSAGTVSWVAIFGNGYNSNSGKAVLFVVDMGTGAIRMIEAVESGAPPGPNGLGNIAVLDTRNNQSGVMGRDGFDDIVYAADQKGALWKFDLLSSASSVSRPLFTTQTHTEGSITYRQPILGGLVTTAGRGGGQMVLFGTGSFYFNGDSGDSSMQSIYGVHDSQAPTPTSTLTASDLFARSIAVDGAETRTITPGTMGLGYNGWYLDLPLGERVVSFPDVASGIVFIPAYSPTVANGCSTLGGNWMYGLNTRTGAPALASVRFGTMSGLPAGMGVGGVRLDTLGSAPVRDVGVGVVSTSRPLPGQDRRCWMRITVPGLAQAMYVPYPCGRQSWRQLQ